MTQNSNSVVILITLLNILVYKLQKLQEAQQKKPIPLSVRPSCRRFSLKDIQLATNNFSEELVIGKGGFGNVYKGIIELEERIVAIKRCKSMSKQGSKEFLTEIEMLSQFQHSHLVSLIGYCDDNEEMILVYDYMSSGTLADNLHKRVGKGDTSLRSLSWVERLQICIGAAQGLDYLHTGTSIENRVIHRDVKTSNILLDENLAAKISDFGLSKKGPANQTCTYVSTRVKGTHGYLDPYYVATHRLTRKTDVYAFGVVLFEVLCGRPALDKSLEEEQINLAGWAQHCFKEGLLDKITDPKIKGDICSDSISTYVDVALKCLHNQPRLRPTMAEVVVSLESALTLQEKSTHYTLVEIIPTDDSQENVDCTMIEVKNTNHKQEHEFMEKGIANVSDDWHHNKQFTGRMTFTKRVGSLLSVTTWVLAGNTDAKRSRYSTGLLSFNCIKPQAVNSQTFPAVDPSVLRRLPRPLRQEDVLQSPTLKGFTFNDLRVATREFHVVLGTGGFGKVFKGWIDKHTFAAAEWGTGQVIAVKRLYNEGSQGHLEWLTEINHLDTLSHPNIVKLIGYCSEKRKRLLVYEFMSQGSLEKYLYRTGDSHFEPLSWNLRISIALGTAKGLAYLHSPEASVIFRDFKPANILLDSNYNAKLSDFGSAKRVPECDETDASRIVGTLGYVAPEYMNTGDLSIKCDIYSYGVVLLQILTGQRAIDRNLPDREENYLVSWVKPYLSSKRKVAQIMSKHIEGQYTLREALRVSSLALKCVSVDPKLRPEANQVVKELEELQHIMSNQKVK